MPKTPLKGSVQIIAGGSTLNLRVEKLAGDPPLEELTIEGRTWYNEELHVLSNWNGTEIVRMPTRFIFNSTDMTDTFLVEHNLGVRWLHVTIVSRTSGLRISSATVVFENNNSFSVVLQTPISDCTIICSF
jgi:hypothetical protein